MSDHCASSPPSINSRRVSPQLASSSSNTKRPLRKSDGGGVNNRRRPKVARRKKNQKQPPRDTAIKFVMSRVRGLSVETMARVVPTAVILALQACAGILCTRLNGVSSPAAAFGDETASPETVLGERQGAATAPAAGMRQRPAASPVWNGTRSYPVESGVLAGDHGAKIHAVGRVSRLPESDSDACSSALLGVRWEVLMRCSLPRDSHLCIH